MSGSPIGYVDKQVGWRLILGLSVTTGLALAIALLPLTWTVLLVLGGVILLATLVEPRLGLILVIVGGPFGTVQQIRLGVMNIGLTELLVVLTVGAWLVRLATRRKDLLQRVDRPALLLPLVIFIGVSLLSLPTTWSLQYRSRSSSSVVGLACVPAVAWGRAKWTRALVLTAVTGGLAVLQDLPVCISDRARGVCPL